MKQDMKKTLRNGLLDYYAYENMIIEEELERSGVIDFQQNQSDYLNVYNHFFQWKKQNFKHKFSKGVVAACLVIGVLFAVSSQHVTANSLITWIKEKGMLKTDVYQYRVKEEAVSVGTLNANIPNGYVPDEVLGGIDKPNHILRQYVRETPKGKDYLGIEKMIIGDGMTHVVNQEWQRVETIEIDNCRYELGYRYNEKDHFVDNFVWWRRGDFIYSVALGYESCDLYDDERIDLEEIKDVIGSMK